MSLDPFGTDFSALPDLNFNLKSGLQNLEEALLRRLSTPRGGLFYDEQYGMDIRGYLNETFTASVEYELRVLSARQCETDERVLEVNVEVLQFNTSSIELKLNVQTNGGEVTKILSITNVTVEVLNGN